MQNRVWIELELPPPNLTEEERRALMLERAKLLSRMLRRLGVKDEEDRVFVRERKRGQEYSVRGGPGFSVWGDCGGWFNLDWLGREEDVLLTSPVVGDGMRRNRAMNEQDFEDLLLGVVQAVEDLEDAEVRPERVQTFRQAAILSDYKGLVVRMDDGSEFRVTIVRTA